MRPGRVQKASGVPPTDSTLALLLVAAALLLAGRAWLAENPQHDPTAPLDLRDERGWATQAKLMSLLGDVEACRAVLDRSEVAYTALEPAGEDQCYRGDRTVLDASELSPRQAPVTCPVAVGYELWVEKDLRPLAREILGSDIAGIRQLGTYSCRRMYGANSGPWSEHATGNAIDIAGFTLEDGRTISLLGGWNGDEDERAFLRAARDAACDSFGTVLSPDYNAAHADHFHLDQGRSPGMGACR